MIHLDPAELLERSRTGTLPAAWTTPARGLWPVVRDEGLLHCDREAVRRGDLVAFERRGGLVWRRVLAVRGGAIRVRADRAPLDDGWFDAWLCRAQARGLLARAASVAPVAWTGLRWGVAAARSSASGALRGVLAREGPPLEVSIEAVADGAEAELRGFLETTWRRRWPRAPSSTSSERWLVAREASGAIVGAATLLLSEAGATCANLVVAPAKRRRGVARRLVEERCARARAAGAPTVRAYVNVSNPPSLRLFRSLGFRPRGWLELPDDRFSRSELHCRELVLNLGG